MNCHFQKTSIGPYRGWLCTNASADAILDTLQKHGQTIKVSAKNVTRRVGDLCVKQSRLQYGLGPIKRTVLRHRYRQPWYTALHLLAQGVPIPRPIAWMERTRMGITIERMYVCAWLSSCQNVETFAKALVAAGADAASIESFLGNLAQEVNRLNAGGAYHGDLSGKNVFTTDGNSFYFIDLDAIRCGVPYTLARRLKNHIQLYDSFCDFLPQEALRTFISAMLPSDIDAESWFRRVQGGQKRRRSRHLRR